MPGRADPELVAVQAELARHADPQYVLDLLAGEVAYLRMLANDQKYELFDVRATVGVYSAGFHDARRLLGAVREPKRGRLLGALDAEMERRWAAERQRA